VEFHAGELFPRLELIVTNLETPSPGGRFYKKGKQPNRGSRRASRQ
jgi:hypothetical protein